MGADLPTASPPDEVYDVLETAEGVDRALRPSSTPSRTRRVWWSAGAQPPQRLADGEVAIATRPTTGASSTPIDERGPAGRDALGLAGLRPRRLGGPGRAWTTARRRQAVPPRSRPTPSGWRTRPSSSPTARPASPRRRWSASMPSTGIDDGAAHADQRRTNRRTRWSANDSIFWADYRRRTVRALQRLAGA
ncbi:MAG: hypothetical protein U5K43_01130 [Halofilum sp. (in: g-proteobacteria)]|nr:hypothetical protein [Halofilum sp. (in: g-proteobacteria)]